MRWATVAGVVVLAGAVAYWALGRHGAPPVPFARVARGRLVSTLSTNARVEPSAWSAIRAPVAGRLASLRVALGDSVRKGQVVGEMESEQARAAVVAAESDVAQARASLDAATRGPSPAAVAEIEGALATARVERDNARRALKNLEALVAAEAATRTERDQAKDRAAVADAEVAALEKRRAALQVDEHTLAAARARVRNAESALSLATASLAKTTIVSPVAGTLYSLEARPGAVLENGATIAEAGDLAELKAVVYVDEPELGRVAANMAVEFTWDALPGRKWSGSVERLPKRIVASGSRQVGEVLCRLENPGQSLPAGANVNATIVSKTVESALIAPREALRRENGRSVVYLLAGGRLERREVRTGAASITHVEILGGLKEGGLVALPADTNLVHGAEVTPVPR